MDIDLSKLSPALIEAAELRMKELGCDSLQQYFDALMPDGTPNPTDPALHAFLSRVGGAFHQDHLRHIRQRQRRPGERPPDFSI